jgi:hypothetical protein
MEWTKIRADRLMPNMVNGGARPNRRIEQLLHHGPVTGMVDKALIGEIRQLGDGSVGALAAAHRTAMEVSLRLQAIVSREVDGT